METAKSIVYAIVVAWLVSTATMCHRAEAAEPAAAPWVYEFELGALLPTADRLLNEKHCTSVVPVEYVKWYATDPRPGWTVACGNKQPVYNHFLGRRCAKPLPKLIIECGWRHFSSPNDRHEISYDAIAVRGRFAFGKGGR